MPNRTLNNKKLGWSLEARDVDFINELMPKWEWFYRYYFRVKSDGWENIPQTGQVLFVGTHNGGLASPDMMMLIYDWFQHFGTNRRIYGLMHPKVWEVNPELGNLAGKVGAIEAHPKMAIAAFRKGASVLVYPGGAEDVFRPYSERHQVNFAGRKGFIKLALRESVPIIPIISTGAHETLIVLGDCYQQAKQLHEWGVLPWLYDVDPEVFPIYLGLPWGIGIGPLPNFPLPSQIHIRICPPITFERTGQKASRDRNYVNECYQLVHSKMQRSLDQLVAETEGQ